MADTMPLRTYRDGDGYVAAQPIINKVSWGAVFAGVAIALTVQLLLNLLGAGVGAAIIDPATSDNPGAGAFSTGAAIWFVASGLIASFFGGYVASRMSGRSLRSIGGLHALTSWAVTTLVIVYLLTTSVGALIGGAFTGLSSIVSGAGSTVSAAAGAAAPAALNTVANPMASIEQRIREASGGNDPAALRDMAVTSMQALLTGDQAKAAEAREQAANALARAQNIPVEQARQQVQTYETQYKEAMETAKQQAADAAQTATKAISAGAVLSVIALAFGALASWLGGFIGAGANRRQDADVLIAR